MRISKRVVVVVVVAIVVAAIILSGNSEFLLLPVGIALVALLEGALPFVLGFVLQFFLRDRELPVRASALLAAIVVAAAAALGTGSHLGFTQRLVSLVTWFLVATWCVNFGADSYTWLRRRLAKP